MPTYPSDLFGSVIGNPSGTASASAAGTAAPGSAYWNLDLSPYLTNPVGSATQADLSASQNISQISDLINAINQAAQQQANLGRIPGEQGMENQSSANIAAELAGKLPQDVINQIAQGSAEWGVGTGSPVGPSSNAALLRALGLTSLQLQNQGQQDFSTATARNPSAPLFDPSMLLLTPAQASEIALRQEQLQAQAELERENMANQAAMNNARISAANARTTNPNSGLTGLGGFGTGATIPEQPTIYTASPAGAATNWTDYLTSTGPSVSLSNYPVNAGGFTVGTGTGINTAGAPSNTTYDPFTNTMNWDPYAGIGYDLGNTSAPPANTTYDPFSDTYNWDPFAGTGFDATGGGSAAGGSVYDTGYDYSQPVSYDSYGGYYTPDTSTPYQTIDLGWTNPSPTFDFNSTDWLFGDGSSDWLM